MDGDNKQQEDRGRREGPRHRPGGTQASCRAGRRGGACSNERGQRMTTGLIVVLAIVGFFVLIVLPMSVRIVREYQRLVLLRLGRSLGARGPGFVLIFPIIDRVILVDLRE